MARTMDPRKCDFYAEIAKTATFQQLIAGTSEFINQAVIKCSVKGGMEVNAVDSGNVGLIKWQFRPNCFSHWRCREPKEGEQVGVQPEESEEEPREEVKFKPHIEVAIDFKRLLLAVKNATPNETIIMFKPLNEDHIEVRFIDEAARDKAVAQNFEEFGSFLRIKLLDLEVDSMSISDFGKDCPQFTMKALEFHQLIANLMHTGKSVSFDVKASGVTITLPTSAEFGQVGKHYKHSAESNLENKNTVVVHAPKPFKDVYSLNYLKTFSKSCPLSDKVIISACPKLENIMRLTFPIHKDSEINFYLGPRNQDDNE